MARTEAERIPNGPVLPKRAYSAQLNELTFLNLEGACQNSLKMLIELIRRLNALTLKELIRRVRSLFGNKKSLFGKSSELIRQDSELIRHGFGAHSAGSELIRQGELIRRKC